MYRKLFLILFPILFLIAFCTAIFSVSGRYSGSRNTSIASILWTASILWAMATALLYGTLLKIKWALVIEIILCLGMIAVPFIAMRRIVDVSVFYIIFPIASALVYLLHFILKKQKQWFADICKLLFVGSTLLAYMAMFLGTNSEEEILVFWLLTFVLLAIAVYRQVYYYRPETFQEAIAEEGNEIFTFTDEK